MSLFHELESGVVQCNSAESKLGSPFLPESLTGEKITKESIAANLSWWDSLWSLPSQVHDQAPKVFAVLVLIGHPLAIRKLINNDNITDDHLPLILIRDGRENSAIFDKTRMKKFTSFQSWTPPSISAFLEKQWLVQAPVLGTAGQILKLHPSCPLPIKSCTHRIFGDGVSVYQACLHPAHAPFSTADSQFAIKEIWAKDVFDREKENLELIQKLGNTHIIKLVACWEQEPFRTGWLVFEWANGGNLRDFWKREDGTPRTDELTLWSLQQVLGLVDAIRSLHEKNIRHGDIKPHNILHFTKGGKDAGRGALVLADVGVSKFHEHETGLRTSATDTIEVTLVYEAPEAEHDRDNNKARSRLYDMWSMGCMLMEFTVWLLYGFEAVEVFRGRRIDRGGYYNRTAAFFSRISQEESIIHPEVARALDKLAADPRCGEGTVLADFLALIKDDLLQIKPQNRTEAPILHRKLEAIVDRAQGDPSYLYRRTDEPPKTPTFFVRGHKGRTSSDSSQSSSGSSITPPLIRGSLESLQSANLLTGAT